MVDAPKPTFKAPPLPPKSATPAPAAASTGLYDDNFAKQFNLSPKLLTTKVMGAILGGVLLLGIIVGGSLFGGDGSKTTQGLSGVVVNKDIPGERRRCGIAEKTQGCVLYLMNATRGDRRVRDFYEEASRITGVAVYTIQLGNIEYATAIIRPGQLAQINIPPQR